MNRTHIKDLAKNAGKEVSISGFVHILRVQSKIIFLILRDVTGIIQTVVEASNPTFDIAKNLSHESVITVTGQVKESVQAPGGF